MRGLVQVFMKELADHFSSRRFIILFTLVALAGLSATYIASQSIREQGTEVSGPSFVFLSLFTAQKGIMPAFVTFISFFGPLVGLALGFDAINSEQSGGTLSRVLAQPLFRDSVINGKFLAGITTIGVMLVSIVLIVSGLGLKMIGVTPSWGEVARIAVFLAISVVYVAFWMGLAVLFSILFRRTSTSALAGIAAWIFFAFFMLMIAGVAADTIAPVDPEEAQTNLEAVARHEETQKMILRISPIALYGEATTIIMSPLDPSLRSLGTIMPSQQIGLITSPLPLGQSLLIVWPHLTTLMTLTAICFAISYVRFMRQEIRPT